MLTKLHLTQSSKKSIPKIFPNRALVTTLPQRIWFHRTAKHGCFYLLLQRISALAAPVIWGRVSVDFDCFVAKCVVEEGMEYGRYRFPPHHNCRLGKIVQNDIVGKGNGRYVCHQLQHHLPVVGCLLFLHEKQITGSMFPNLLPNHLNFQELGRISGFDVPLDSRTNKPIYLSQQRSRVLSDG
jgi:hypothetical protein